MTKELTWFQQEVIERRRMLVTGTIHRLRGNDSDIHGHFNAVQIIELTSGGYIYLNLSYTRFDREFGKNAGQDSPELTVRAEWTETLDEAAEVWTNNFYSPHWTEGEHDSVRVGFHGEDGRAKLFDPWVIYHLGVFAQITRAAEFTCPEADFVRDKAVTALEAIATNRIKRIAQVIGRS